MRAYLMFPVDILRALELQFSNKSFLSSRSKYFNQNILTWITKNIILQPVYSVLFS